MKLLDLYPKLAIAILLCIVTCTTLNGQDRPYRHIKTNEYLERIKKKDKAEKKAQHDLKKWLKKSEKESKRLKGVVIPVVFHVLYTSEENKITEDQVMSQVQALNDHFGDELRVSERDSTRKEKDKQYKKGGFNKLADQAGIQFCLGAQKKGNSLIKGIQYYSAGVPVSPYDNTIKEKKDGGADAWDTDKFINIWITDLPDSVSGYAQMPGYDKATDGIVVDYRYVGRMGTALSPYAEGKTLVHLIGNYLGVPSAWSKNCTSDIRDVPPHNAPNFGCPGYRHVSTCYGFPLEMTMNFMDNTDDACMYMFTRGQIDRMHAALSKGGPRYGLWNHTETVCHDLEEVSLREQLNEEPPNASRAYLSIYPNPGRSFLTIESGQIPSEEPVRVDIIDITGKRVWQQRELFPNSIFKIDCGSWSRGIYFVVINNKVSEPYQKIILL